MCTRHSIHGCLGHITMCTRHYIHGCLGHITMCTRHSIHGCLGHITTCTRHSVHGCLGHITTRRKHTKVTGITHSLIRALLILYIRHSYDIWAHGYKTSLADTQLRSDRRSASCVLNTGIWEETAVLTTWEGACVPHCFKSRLVKTDGSATATTK
jgi:hypothetical protein